MDFVAHMDTWGSWLGRSRGGAQDTPALAIGDCHQGKAGLRPKWVQATFGNEGYRPTDATREFVQSHAGASDQQVLKAALDAWFAELRRANWSSMADVKRLYGFMRPRASSRAIGSYSTFEATRIVWSSQSISRSG